MKRKREKREMKRDEERWQDGRIQGRVGKNDEFEHGVQSQSGRVHFNRP
jgi:hypothetical protein